MVAIGWFDRPAPAVRTLIPKKKLSPAIELGRAYSRWFVVVQYDAGNFHSTNYLNLKEPCSYSVGNRALEPPVLPGARQSFKRGGEGFDLCQG